MLDVRPFAAIRYNARRFGHDLSRVIAPPYDVLDESDKAALLAADPHNIVAVDLPHVPPKDAGPTEVYDRSAGLLRQWLAEGVLVRENQPALYVYHQTFEQDGRTYTRKKFIARLRLAAFSEGVILPHERTFGGPKDDRLALMKATRCNLSPIFGLYSDDQNSVGAALAGAIQRPPDCVATLENVENRVWVVPEKDTIDRVAAEMRTRKVYIADGHHRYATALLYRDDLAGRTGGLSADHPANFVMFVLASMDDPGCVILPYHRVIGGLPLDTLLDAWSDGVSPAPVNKVHDLRLWDAASGREVKLAFTDRAILRTLEKGEVAPWYDLDYAYLHRYLIDELLSKKRTLVPDVHYAKSERQARQLAREHRGVALLVNATPMVHLRAVSDAGGLMPQKSTYFHPKLATGLTIHPLE
jgi:uncharacterized protein (DUF1015 family)